MADERGGGWSGPDRRDPENRWQRDLHDKVATHDERLGQIEDDLKEGTRRMESLTYSNRLLGEKLDRNTSVTEGIAKDTSELVAVANNIFGAHAVGKWVLKSVLLLGSVIGMIFTAIYFAYTGHLPGR